MTDVAADLEFRCILVEKARTPDLNLLVDSAAKTPPAIYFNLAIAEQVSPANYTKATNVSGKYEIKILADTTDNFGNIIKPGTQYKPYILTIDNSPNSSPFVNVLADFPLITV